MAYATATSSDLLVRQLSLDVIGRNHVITTPFGEHALCYADFTASGRALQSVEAFLQREVLPFYGNTHTTTSTTGLITTRFREQARRTIADAVHANAEGDAVIFTGSGTTGAVHKLVTALGLHVPMAASVDPAKRPVVFVGPFEHHSNLLCWRESGAHVVVIPENGYGHVDVNELTCQLQRFANRRLKIGAFSAASNLTGVLTDVDLVTATLHKHGALALWDYASCAPYVAIDMNPIDPLMYKDAIYFSGHKSIGGPGSPGVLVVKKRLLKNAVPTAPGGGTVFFVSERDHRYLHNAEEREEGGTPDILGSIRLGLAFEIKQRIGAEHIIALEHQHVARVRASLASNANVVLLGHDGVEQLPVFSFVIRCGQRFLHYNFVSALLNDLFGVQSRSGCQCAGPYATRLLGITKEDLFAIERRLVQGVEVLRPGSSRFSIPYFVDDDEIEFILQAVHFVANYGHKFLHLYNFDLATGLWKHKDAKTTESSEISQLADFAFSDEKETAANQDEADVGHLRQQALDRAQELVSTFSKQPATVSHQLLPAACEPLRWFVYANENEAVTATSTKPVGPFQPQRYVTGDLLRQWDEPQTDARATSAAFPLRTPRTPRTTDSQASVEPKRPNPWRKLREAMKRHLRRHGRAITSTRVA